MSIHRNPLGTADANEGREAEVGRWREVDCTCVYPIICASVAVKQRDYQGWVADRAARAARSLN